MHRIGDALLSSGNPTGPAQLAAPSDVGSWIGGHIVDAVAGLMRSLCHDLLTNVAGPVLRYVLRTPDLLAEPTLRRTWLLSLAALFACTGLLVAISGLALIPGPATKLGIAARETLGVRLWTCLLTASVSLPVMALEVGLANRLADVFVAGSGAAGKHAVWQTLTRSIGGDAGARLGVLAVATVGVVLLVALVVLGLVRWASIWLLVVLAPLAMGFAALPGGGALSRVWWRLQLAAIFLPIANAALLSTYTAMFSSNRNGLVGALSGVAILALMTKLPAWVAGIAVGAEAHDVTHRLRRTHGTARSLATNVAGRRAAAGLGATAGPAGAAVAGAAAKASTGPPRRVPHVRGRSRGGS